MYKLITIICLALCAENVYSALARLPPQPVPEEYECEAGCYIPKFKAVIGFGESHYPLDGSCSRYNCQKDGWTVIATCGVAVFPGCEPTFDYSKPYPGCCANFDHCKAPAQAIPYAN